MTGVVSGGALVSWAPGGTAHRDILSIASNSIVQAPTRNCCEAACRELSAMGRASLTESRSQCVPEV